MWSQDSFDWDGASPYQILSSLMLVPPGGTFTMHDAQPNSLAAIPGISRYFNQYWKDALICSGRLANATKEQPVLDWPGLYYFATAVR